LGLLDCDSKF